MKRHVCYAIDFGNYLSAVATVVAGMGWLRYLPWGSKIVLFIRVGNGVGYGLSRRNRIDDRLSRGRDCPVLLHCSFLF